jgi:hypothetical protein
MITEFLKVEVSNIILVSTCKTSTNRKFSQFLKVTIHNLVVSGLLSYDAMQACWWLYKTLHGIIFQKTTIQNLLLLKTQIS